MRIDDFRKSIQPSMVEELEPNNSSPIDSGSVEATAEAARKLIKAGISLCVSMHGENADTPSLKNKSYISVPQRFYNQAKSIIENVKDLIDD